MPKEIEVRVRIIGTVLGGYDPGLARSINGNGSQNSEHYTGRGPGSASGSVFRSEDPETEPYLLSNSDSSRMGPFEG
jgi:hypothetical protein